MLFYRWEVVARNVRGEKVAVNSRHLLRAFAVVALARQSQYIPEPIRNRPLYRLHVERRLT